jgi:hypothetical protein
MASQASAGGASARLLGSQGVVSSGDGVYPFGGNIRSKISDDLRCAYSCGVAGLSGGESDVIHVIGPMEGKERVWNPD